MANTGLTCIVCGKYMYPQTLLDARTQTALGIMPRRQYRRVVLDCLTELVEKQHRAGLKYISDGCIDREFWDLDFYFGLNGIEKRQTKSGHVYDDCNDGPVPAVVSRITYDDENPVFAQCRQLCDRLDAHDRATVLLPAPAHFLLRLLMNDTTWKSVYTDTLQLVDDIARAYNATILQLRADGCGTIIFEDRSWQSLCSRDGIKKILQGGHDPYSLALSLRNVNDAALADLPSDSDILLYLRRLDSATSTWFMSDHCMKITDRAFGHDNVGTYVLDMPDESEEEVEALLKRLPEDKNVILGIVDGRHPQLEEEETLRSKISTARSIVGSRLRGITPTGGFKRETTQICCNAFTEEDQWRKISLLQHVADTI